jgi:hypothetical protein
MIAFGIDNNIKYDFVNEFSNEYIYLNKFLSLSTEFIQVNSKIITLTDNDKYRPDKLAYEYYGDDMYYPCILAANNLGSVFSFKPDRLNFECYIPNVDFVERFLTVDN